MPDRDQASRIARFLSDAGWGTAQRRPLAGDASTRRYERLTQGAHTAILMDSAGTKASVDAFLRVGDWLRRHGYSAPQTLAAEPDAGLLLVEDLGDALFARLIEADPSLENSLYSAAISFLADLHRHPAPAFVAPLDGPALGAALELTLEWYPRAIDQAPAPDALQIPALVDALHARLAHDPPVLSLRDFHAENLIHLPLRRPPGDLGLLDYQDAVAAHRAYDLVSLLQDARRDVSPDREAQMFALYTARNRLDPVAFRAAYALLGAQRQLRIVGVFARLCLQSGKPGYLVHLPRVWRYLDRNLDHPALADLARIVRATLPAPTPERIERIKAQCRALPHP